MKIGEGKLFISRNLIKLASPDVGFDGSIPDIQQLLQQLNQSYPSQVSSETKAEIEVAVRGISKDQTLRQKVIGALKAGSMEALRELADNPYVNILLAAWEGCQGS